VRKKEVGGFILIILGIFLLLFNLGYVNFNIFLSLLDLWPLFLIAIGVNIIFKNKRLITYISWIIIFIIIIVYGLLMPTNTTDEVQSETLTIEKLPDTSYGHLKLDIGASQLKIASTKDHLLEADLRGRPLDFRESYMNNRQRAVLDFQTRPFKISGIQRDRMYDSYTFKLNEDIIWDIDLDLGAVSCELNLEDLAVRKIDLDSGATDMTFILGKRHDLDFDINTGASDIKIILPPDVGLRVEMDSALSNSNLKDLNIVKRGDYYISPDYDRAEVTIHLDIDMGVGNIEFIYSE